MGTEVTAIALIVPSRGRPHNVKRLAQAVTETASEVHLTIAVDEDDPTLETYRDDHDSSEELYVLHVGPRRRLVGTLNELATRVEHRYVAFMGDDHLPRTEGWDKRFLAELDSIGPGGMVYGDDRIQGANLPTHVCMDRRIVDALGFMAPPVLTHLYADNFWMDLGNALGTLRYVPDAVVEHMHPASGQGAWDATYADANSVERDTADRQAYLIYRDTQFPLDVARVKEALDG
jgi:hypothetical protein